MIRCSRCGTENPDGATNCASCAMLLRASNPFEGNAASPGNNNAYTHTTPAGAPPPFVGAQGTPPPMNYGTNAHAVNYGAAPQQTYQNPADVYHTAYGSASPTNFNSWKDNSPVTAGQWVALFAMNFIPVIGNLVFFIIMIIFAVGGTQKKALVNFARAFFIVFVVVMIISMISGGSSEVSDILDEYARLSPMLFGLS